MELLYYLITGILCGAGVFLWGFRAGLNHAIKDISKKLVYEDDLK